MLVQQRDSRSYSTRASAVETSTGNSDGMKPISAASVAKYLSSLIVTASLLSVRSYRTFSQLTTCSTHNLPAASSAAASGCMIAGSPNAPRLSGGERTSIAPTISRLCFPPTRFVQILDRGRLQRPLPGAHAGTRSTSVVKYSRRRLLLRWPQSYQLVRIDRQEAVCSAFEPKSGLRVAIAPGSIQLPANRLADGTSDRSPASSSCRTAIERKRTKGSCGCLWHCVR